MPVIKPEAGGAPDAIAMPMQSGKATKNTMMDAGRSDRSVSSQPPSAAC